MVSRNYQFVLFFLIPKLKHLTDENMEKQLRKIIIAIKYSLFLLSASNEILHIIVSYYLHNNYNRN